MKLCTPIFVGFALIAGLAEGAGKTSTTTPSKLKTTSTSSKTTSTSAKTISVSATSTSPFVASSLPASTTTSSTSSSSAISSTPALSASSTASPVSGATVDQTILVFARSSTEAYSAYSGLLAYGIPYQLVIVPQSGITLPTLNSSDTHGNYAGIITLSEVSYDYDGTWAPAITTDQYNQLYAYQTSFGVKMVRLDVYPDAQFGTTTAISGTGCCSTGVEQLISFTNLTGFSTANLVSGATMTTQSLYHYPATITDTTGSTWQVAQFAPDSAGQFTGSTTAAVINNWSGRQQMVFFTSWATQWSPTSNFLQHAYIHWMTRGVFLGARKTYLSTQVDDVHLTTGLYQPNGSFFRLRPADLPPHVSWMASLNSRLPAGSKYKMELAHNGNGDIINATNTEYNVNVDVCDPVDAVYPDDQPDTALEFQKPLGTGTNFWPATLDGESLVSYNWSLTCAKVDRLLTWFTNTANRDAFSHISHTFTHLNLDNATYSDTFNEITFNQAWLKQVGISAGTFSPNGLVPPAITGMHNGDAINAWMANGITQVVGDNSRPSLLNPTNPYWALISDMPSNGYAGLTIIPRWPTTIYYNCDLPACTTQEWIDTSAGSGSFTDLLDYERFITSRYLLALRQDPYMFHQANLRSSDVPGTTVGSVTVYSLIQIWVETVTQEMMRLTNWPIVTKKHDDLAQLFLQRMARDNCNPNLTYMYSSDGTRITAVTVTASGNTCSAPIPVTLPTSASSTGTVARDQVGSEPLIVWVTLSGSPVTLTLSTPVAL
ncbi:hypothetical protein H2203_005217 [Taxawa tesnikishii (nom. ined.)]|nr:hypothetical protein H2203_005217 [Dothideales sp. JES 119]